MRRVVDGEDRAAHYTATTRRARIEGPGVWLEPLATLEKWAAQPEEAQDQAAEEVARRLGSGWALRDVRWWECPIEAKGDRCIRCGHNNNHHRINEEEIDEYWDQKPGGPPRSFPCRLADCGCIDMAFEETIRHRLALFEHRATGAEFSLVPGGVSEVPLETTLSVSLWREVAIRPLLVARWPVTFRQYYKGQYPWPCDENPDDSLLDLPTTRLDWDEVDLWSENEGLRLPTAAEWQHAAGGGSPTRFPWGDDVDLAHVWCLENTRGRGMSIVSPGSVPPAEHDAAGRWNAFGLVDCVGNVWEWLADGGLAGDAYNSQDCDIDGCRTIAPRYVPQGDSAPNYGLRPVADIPGLGAE